MSEETRHLYELLGKDQFRETVLPGLDRLLSALEEKASLMESSVTIPFNLEQHVCETSDRKIVFLGTDLNDQVSISIEARNQLNDVCTILAALSLPSTYNDLENHVGDAFYRVRDAIGDFQRRRDRRLAARKDETAASRTAPPTVAPLPDHLSIGVAWASAFLKFMNKINAELGRTIHQMTKNDLKAHIETHWDDNSLGEPSEHKIDAMATLLRLPEAQKGRAKPKS